MVATTPEDKTGYYTKLMVALKLLHDWAKEDGHRGETAKLVWRFERADTLWLGGTQSAVEHQKKLHKNLLTELDQTLDSCIYIVNNLPDHADDKLIEALATVWRWGVDVEAAAPKEVIAAKLTEFGNVLHGRFGSRLPVNSFNFATRVKIDKGFLADAHLHEQELGVGDDDGSLRR